MNSDDAVREMVLGESLVSPLPVTKLTVARFLAKIEKANGVVGCWSWTGSKTPDGYGMFYSGTNNSWGQRPHRLAYSIYTGPIPDGYHVHHLCDNRACVNPNHLRVVDPSTHATMLTPRSVTFENTTKITCPKGHAYTVSYREDGRAKRVCRQCQLEWATAKRNRTRIVKPPAEVCIHGHSWTLDNTIIDKYGRRACRECRKEISLRHYYNKKIQKESGVVSTRDATHCPHGHEMTPENTYMQFSKAVGKAHRSCRRCRYEAATRSRLKRAGKLV